MRFRGVWLGVALVALVAAPAAAQESLEVSFDTTEAGGNYAPENIVAVWIEDDAGVFVKTVGRWAGERINHLVAWSAASGQDTDAISGATRPNHDQRLTVTWDMTDFNGAPVADGTYTIRMELADRNSSVPSDNNQGAFAFVKDGQSGTDTTAGGGFDNVSIVYTVETTGGMCGDGVLDTGETCDPVDTCPTSCAPAEDACIAVALTGSPANCDAECVETTISACVDDDGCCPDGCTDADDNDCDGGAGYSGDLQSTGCRVGGGGSPGRALVVALALLLALARRRR